MKCNILYLNLSNYKIRYRVYIAYKYKIHSTIIFKYKLLCFVFQLRICILKLYQICFWRSQLESRRPIWSAPINSRLNVVVRSPTPFGLGRNGCWPSRGSQLPRALPIHFFAMLPPERPQKGSTRHLYNRSPVLTFSSLLSYSCPPSSPHSSSSPDER